MGPRSRQVLADVCDPLARFTQSIVDLAWKLIAGICRSLNPCEKIAALHSFDEESGSAGVHRDATD